MTDALKLAEEALERAFQLSLAMRRFVGENDLEEYSVIYDDADCDGACLVTDCGLLEDQTLSALTTIRAARAEWGWRPIAEMAEWEPVDVMIGKWTGNIWSMCAVTYRSAATNNSYTRFYRPQLPPPPTREEVGNG